MGNGGINLENLCDGENPIDHFWVVKNQYIMMLLYFSSLFNSETHDSMPLVFFFFTSTEFNVQQINSENIAPSSEWSITKVHFL